MRPGFSQTLLITVLQTGIPGLCGDGNVPRGGGPWVVEQTGASFGLPKEGVHGVFLFAYRPQQGDLREKIENIGINQGEEGIRKDEDRAGIIASKGPCAALGLVFFVLGLDTRQFYSCLCRLPLPLPAIAIASAHPAPPNTYIYILTTRSQQNDPRPYPTKIPSYHPSSPSPPTSRKLYL